MSAPIPLDAGACIRRDCPGRWEVTLTPVTAADVLAAAEPLCPDMTCEQRVALPLRTIDQAWDLLCPVCGQTGRRTTFRRIDL